jgi:hypothetical protein
MSDLKITLVSIEFERGLLQQITFVAISESSRTMMVMAYIGTRLLSPPPSGPAVEGAPFRYKTVRRNPWASARKDSEKHY